MTGVIGETAIRLGAALAAAARAYDEYLRLRTDPDAPFRAQRDSVVNERAALSRLTHP